MEEENMTGKEALEQYKEIAHKLNYSLMTFDRKDNIQKYRLELLHLQEQCPHFDAELNLTFSGEHCPYCDKLLVNRE